MPPNTVSGNVMRAQMTRMMQMVPNGSAAVDCMHHGPQYTTPLTDPKHHFPVLQAPVADERMARGQVFQRAGKRSAAYPVYDGHSVEEGEAGQHGAAEERRCQQDIAHPVCPTHHLVAQ